MDRSKPGKRNADGFPVEFAITMRAAWILQKLEAH
jgi:hypothetical protein